MTERDKRAEEDAILFHETYEKLAPSFGYETRKDTKAFDPESANGKLMIAVCGIVCTQAREEGAKVMKERCVAVAYNFPELENGYVIAEDVSDAIEKLGVNK